MPPNATKQNNHSRCGLSRCDVQLHSWGGEHRATAQQKHKSTGSRGSELGITWVSNTSIPQLSILA